MKRETNASNNFLFKTDKPNEVHKTQYLTNKGKCMLKILRILRVEHVVFFVLVSYSLNVNSATTSVVISKFNKMQSKVSTELYNEGLISKKYYSINKQQILAIKGKNTKGGTASINGKIIDENSNPLSMHAVTLYNATTLNNPTANTQTDALGNFNFPGLDAGDYVLFTGTNGDGYLHYVWQDVVFGGPRLCHQCNSSVTSDSFINVAVGATVNNIDVSTQLGGVITGFMKDATNLDAVNTLSAIAVNISDNSYNLKFQFSNTDMLTGEYQITGVPNGSYKLFLEGKVAENNEYIPQLLGGSQCNACAELAFDNQGSDLVITGLNTISNVDFELNKGASISGKIVDALSGDALTVPSLFLIFDELNNLITNHFILGTNSVPSATGDYFIGGLLPGSYYLQGGDLGFDFYQREVYNNKPCYWSGCDRSTGDPLVLGVRQAVTGIDFLLEKGGKISGSITSTATGMPITDANVQVQFFNSTGNVVGGARTKSDGTYISARGLPPGNYAVRTGNLYAGALTRPYINEKYNDVECSGLACDLTTADVSVVANTITPAIDFILDSGYSFSGTMTELATGNPIPDVHVLVYQDMGDGTVKFANWATTSDGSNAAIGSFEVAGLPAGTFYAVTNNGSNLPFPGIRPANGDGWLDILYDGMPCPAAGCDIITGTPIVISSTRGTGVNLTITMIQGASISGKITDDVLNSPIPEIKINVYNQNDEYFGSYTTDETGRYQTAGLPADTYYLTTSSFEVLIDMKYGNTPCYVGSCNPLDAKPIILANQQNKTGIDFVLIPTSDFVFTSSFE